MRTLLIIAIVLLYLNVYAQKNDNLCPSLKRRASITNMKEVISKIKYPKKLKDKGVEGVVRIRILVDEQGNIAKIVVLDSPHPSLTRTVKKAIKYAICEPAIDINDKPVKYWITLPFRFKLPEHTN